MCKHENFSANVRVNRLEDTGCFSADITIKCDECGEPFRFIGLACGLDPNTPMVSVDGTEARMPIGPSKAIASCLDNDYPYPGFTIRRSV